MSKPPKQRSCFMNILLFGGGLLALVLCGLVAVGGQTMNRAGGTATSVPATAASVSLQEQTGYVSRATFGDAWPLTIDEGLLQCGTAKAITLTDTDGTIYAINLPAKGQADTQGWQDIDSIRSGDAKLEPLIDRGLALCS